MSDTQEFVNEVIQEIMQEVNIKEEVEVEPVKKVEPVKNLEPVKQVVEPVKKVEPVKEVVEPVKEVVEPVKEELVKEEPVNKELNASDVIPVVETPQKKRNWLLNYFNWTWK